MSRPDFMEQFDIDLDVEGFDDVDFEMFSSPIEGVELTEQAARFYSPESVSPSDELRAEMEAIHRGLVANFFPDHPTVQ